MPLNLSADCPVFRLNVTAEKVIKLSSAGLSPKYNNIEVDGVQLNGVDFDRSAGLEYNSG